MECCECEESLNEIAQFTSLQLRCGHLICVNCLQDRHKQSQLQQSQQEGQSSKEQKTILSHRSSANDLENWNISDIICTVCNNQAARLTFMPQQLSPQVQEEQEQKGSILQLDSQKQQKYQEQSNQNINPNGQKQKQQQELTKKKIQQQQQQPTNSQLSYSSCFSKKNLNVETTGTSKPTLYEKQLLDLKNMSKILFLSPSSSKTNGITSQREKNNNNIGNNPNNIKKQVQNVSRVNLVEKQPKNNKDKIVSPQRAAELPPKHNNYMNQLPQGKQQSYSSQLLCLQSISNGSCSKNKSTSDHSEQFQIQPSSTASSSKNNELNNNNNIHNNNNNNKNGQNNLKEGEDLNKDDAIVKQRDQHDNEKIFPRKLFQNEGGISEYRGKNNNSNTIQENLKEKQQLLFQGNNVLTLQSPTGLTAKEKKLAAITALTPRTHPMKNFSQQQAQDLNVPKQDKINGTLDSSINTNSGIKSDIQEKQDLNRIYFQHPFGNQKPNNWQFQEGIQFCNPLRRVSSDCIGSNSQSQEDNKNKINIRKISIPNGNKKNNIDNNISTSEVESQFDFVSQVGQSAAGKEEQLNETKEPFFQSVDEINIIDIPSQHSSINIDNKAQLHNVDKIIISSELQDCKQSKYPSNIRSALKIQINQLDSCGVPSSTSAGAGSFHLCEIQEKDSQQNTHRQNRQEDFGESYHYLDEVNWKELTELKEQLKDLRKGDRLKCCQHDETFSLYCDKDRTLLCVSCLFENNIHSKHAVIPIKAASTAVSMNAVLFKGQVREKAVQIDDYILKATENKSILERGLEKSLSQVSREFQMLKNLILQKQKQIEDSINKSFEAGIFRYDSILRDLKEIKDVTADTQNNLNNNSHPYVGSPVGSSNNSNSLESVIKNHFLFQNILNVLQHVKLSLADIRKQDLEIFNFRFKDEMKSCISELGSVKYLQDYHIGIRKTNDSSYCNSPSVIASNLPSPKSQSPKQISNYINSARDNSSNSNNPISNKSSTRDLSHAGNAAQYNYVQRTLQAHFDSQKNKQKYFNEQSCNPLASKELTTPRNPIRDQQMGYQVVAKQNNEKNSNLVGNKSSRNSQYTNKSSSIVNLHNNSYHQGNLSQLHCSYINSSIHSNTNSSFINHSNTGTKQINQHNNDTLSQNVVSLHSYQVPSSKSNSSGQNKVNSPQNNISRNSSYCTVSPSNLIKGCVTNNNNNNLSKNLNNKNSSDSFHLKNLTAGNSGCLSQQKYDDYINGNILKSPVSKQLSNKFIPQETTKSSTNTIPFQYLKSQNVGQRNLNSLNSKSNELVPTSTMQNQSGSQQSNGMVFFLQNKRFREQQSSQSTSIH